MDVVPVADARARLSQLIARFREDPSASPVTIGSHRRPEAVLLSMEAYQDLSAERGGLTLRDVRRFAPVIDRLAQAAHLGDVRVIGSVARGDQHADSDLDLLVTPEAQATTFDVAQFELDLEALFGVAVTVVSERGLDAVRDEAILRGAVAL